MLKSYNVHHSAWVAVLVLLLSFLIGWVLTKYVLVSLVGLEISIRIWLIICLLPLFVLAFLQRTYREINPSNSQYVRHKCYIMAIQVILIYVVSFLLVQFNFASYNTFVSDVFISLPILIPLLVGYVIITDRYMQEPNDEYALIAGMITKQIPKDNQVIKKFLLKMLVKIVFVPFMYSGFLDNLIILLNTTINFSVPSLSLLVFNIGINLDMLVGIFGYIFSSALINNQIRDTDENISGWLFALLCYPPLNWLMHRMNQQQDDLIWSNIIEQGSLLYYLFFIIINGLWITYFLATFEFGMTFSNLSYRKLIDKGVYRYTKHPAYISKNLYWWLYTLPFCGVVFFSLAWWQNVLGLTFVSLTYFGRAWSEERHLNKFPEYREYSQKIDKTGFFRHIRLPPNSYSLGK